MYNFKIELSYLYLNINLQPDFIENKKIWLLNNIGDYKDSSEYKIQLENSLKRINNNLLINYNIKRVNKNNIVELYKNNLLLIILYGKDFTLEEEVYLYIKLIMNTEKK